MIVDDFKDARATIRIMLERGGHEVIEASNGKEGLKMIEQQGCDVIVTDILMPEMEGLELVRRIVKSKPDLPIIVFTASTNTPYLETALKMGAVIGLYKPFKQADLVTAVHNALCKTDG